MCGGVAATLAGFQVWGEKHRPPLILSNLLFFCWVGGGIDGPGRVTLNGVLGALPPFIIILLTFTLWRSCIHSTIISYE